MHGKRWPLLIRRCALCQRLPGTGTSLDRDGVMRPLTVADTHGHRQHLDSLRPDACPHTRLRWCLAFQFARKRLPCVTRVRKRPIRKHWTLYRPRPQTGARALLPLPRTSRAPRMSRSVMLTAPGSAAAWL